MMTNEELITELSRRLNWPETKVAETLEAAVEVMNAKLTENIPLSLQDLGDFITRRKTEYISVNPRNNERWLIPPAIELLFEAAPELKERLLKNI
ncbi:MAG: HU family DNA-binding protein [Proteiniphilum sp.]|jgi:nucleoid DNA-binding protein|nr:HU family DNA-binding protein [Proteiniphilum sp.]